MSKSPVACWDFTLPFSSNDDFLKVKKQLLEICKSGTFQKEEGASGYLHYNGRVSLKKKMRLPPVGTPNFLEGVHWSPTSNACRNNVDYVSKDYTRVDGPWDITEKIDYIPKQIRDITSLYDWQSTIINQLNIWDTRSINMVYCKEGNKGKSTLCGWCRAYKLARCLPPVNDYKDMLRMVCDLPTSRAYMIDMPRALKKDKLGQFYSAIETLKDGYAYDDRYTFKEKIFDCPNVWIFSNILPDFSLLSGDRWKIWEITPDLKLDRVILADCVL